MNKKVLIAATLLTAMFAQAQESGSGDEVVKNKKGNEILPKAGDIALGFNTVPMLDMLMNAVKLNSGGGAVTSANTNQYVQGASNMIVGKYYLTNKSAIRARIGINTIGGSITNRVADSRAVYDASFGNSEEQAAAAQLRVEDKYKFQKTNILVTAGYEMRRGYRRLQGFYGGEVAFGGGGSKETFTYGNDFSDQYSVQYTNPNVVGGNFTNVVNTNPTAPGRQERTLYNSYRGGFRMGARAFIGVEYFVFAKISIGAEFGWGWSYTTRTNKISTVEVYENAGATANVFNEDRSNDSNEKTRGFSVDNNGNPAGSPFSMNNTQGGSGNTAGQTALSGGSGAITILFHF